MNEVYAHPLCLFHYCPDPETCKACVDGCIHKAAPVAGLEETQPLSAEEVAGAFTAESDKLFHKYPGYSDDKPIEIPMQPGVIQELRVPYKTDISQFQIVKDGSLEPDEWKKGDNTAGMQPASCRLTSWERFVLRIFPPSYTERPPFPENLKQHDTVNTHVHITIGWLDRIKILFSGRAVCRVESATEHNVGRAFTSSVFYVAPPAWMKVKT